MDEVFGNSSGETVVESPLNLTAFEEEQRLSDDEKDEAHLSNSSNSKEIQLKDGPEKDDLNIVCSKSNETDTKSENVKNVRGSNTTDLKAAADEFIKNLQSKIVDLNDTILAQNEQNTENHHLEKKLRDLDEDLYMTLNSFSSQQYKYVNDISKTPCDISVQINSSIQDYMSHMTKIGNFQRLLSKQNESTWHPKVINDISAHLSPRIPLRNPSQSPPCLPQSPSNLNPQSPPPRILPIKRTKTCALVSPRPRSQTSVTTATRHLYQNLPAPATLRHSFNSSMKVMSHAVRGPMMPVYVNVPEPAVKSTSSSFKDPYIELWGTGKPESKNLFPFQELGRPKSSSLPSTPSSQSPQCRKSLSPAYVQMSSPYVRSPVSAVFAQLSSSIASYAGHAPQTIFCPLCPRQFSYERTLAGHIQKSHRLELESMIDGKPGDLNLYSCPVCQARFFNGSVLPKHLTDCHKDSVIPLLEQHRCIAVKNKGMQCPFCVKCVPAGVNGEHMMIFHLQQYHAGQFQNMVSSLFKVCNGGDVKVHNSSTMMAQDISSTPGLSNKLVSMTVTSDSKRKLEDLQKEELCIDEENSAATHGPLKTPNSYEKQEPRRTASKGILRRDKRTGDRPSVKRELRFSVPHVTQEEIYYPESPGPITPDYTERIDLNAFSFPRTEKVNYNQPLPLFQEDFEVIATEEFVDVNQHGARKRRKLGLNIRSKNIFKCKDKENQEVKAEEREYQQVYMSMNGRSYRRPPKPVPPPTIPLSKFSGGGSPCAAKLHSTNISSTSSTSSSISSTTDKTTSAENVSDRTSEKINSVKASISCSKNITDQEPEADDPSQQLDKVFSTSVKLYSPLRLFRCNGCRNKFCDNDSLLVHISQQHRGFLSLLRPQFGCGICSAKFYENKHLVKHCLQNHFSLLEIRSASGEVVPVATLSRVDPSKMKIRGSLREAKQPVTAL